MIKQPLFTVDHHISIITSEDPPKPKLPRERRRTVGHCPCPLVVIPGHRWQHRAQGSAPKLAGALDLCYFLLSLACGAGDRRVFDVASPRKSWINRGSLRVKVRDLPGSSAGLGRWINPGPVISATLTTPLGPFRCPVGPQGNVLGPRWTGHRGPRVAAVDGRWWLRGHGVVSSVGGPHLQTRIIAAHFNEWLVT